MIKWYDWVIAVIAADFILAGAIVGLTAPTIWMQFIGALSATVLYDLWVNFYCVFRKKQEQNR